MIVPVILAGGSGTRLWPLSRKSYPKQMINFTNEHSMLQDTILRLAGLDDVSSPVVLCNEQYRFMIAEQLRNIDTDKHTIILEPAVKNTAPAIAAAAVKIMDKDGLNPVMLVLPADHVIERIPDFHAVLKQGYYYAEKGNFVTFGVIPCRPETGYGYIRKGTKINKNSNVYRIKNFIEKPDKKTARTYVESGNYCWNSGIFMFKASAIINELEKYSPDIVKTCRNSVKKGVNDLDFFRLDKNYFSASPSNSLDYAVMEKTKHGIVIPFDAGWNDLGSWEALWQTGEKDTNNNVIKGDIIIHDVHNSYIRAETRLVAAAGLDNHIIVETGDAVLVACRDKAQDVKELVDRLKKYNRREIISHKRDYRPWGACEIMDDYDRFKVNRITVKPGAKLSMHKHFHRAEHWIIVSGTALIIKDNKKHTLKENQSIYIPAGVLHKMENPGKVPLELIEIQSGSYLDEDDIIRCDGN